MIISQVNDEKIYKNLNLNQDPAITRYIPSLIDSEYKYLGQNYFERSNFHGLPKIQKSKVLHEAIKGQNKECITISGPKDLQLWTIVGGLKYPTRSLSTVLDLILKPLTKHVTRNIKGNLKFLKTCKRNATDDTILVTFDECSLYTNLPHELGLRAIEYFVSNYKQSINPRFTT